METFNLFYISRICKSSFLKEKSALALPLILAASLDSHRTAGISHAVGAATPGQPTPGCFMMPDAQRSQVILDSQWAGQEWPEASAAFPRLPHRWLWGPELSTPHTSSPGGRFQGLHIDYFLGYQHDNWTLKANPALCSHSLAVSTTGWRGTRVDD